MPHYPKIAPMSGLRPEASQQPPIPVRPPESPSPQRTPGKGISIQPKALSMFNWDVNPMTVFKQLFGKEADVDESTGIVKLPNAGPVINAGPVVSNGTNAADAPR